jgi:hypothetical protein
MNADERRWETGGARPTCRSAAVSAGPAAACPSVHIATADSVTDVEFGGAVPPHPNPLPWREGEVCGGLSVRGDSLVSNGVEQLSPRLGGRIPRKSLRALNPRTAKRLLSRPAATLSSIRNGLEGRGEEALRFMERARVKGKEPSDLANVADSSRAVGDPKYLRPSAFIGGFPSRNFFSPWN